MVESSNAAPISKIDLLKLAGEMLDEIERFRAYDPLSRDDASKGGSHIPSESRVNTFFRLVGFPSIVSIKAIDAKRGVTGGKETDAAALTPGYKFGHGVRGATVRNTNKQSLKVDGAKSGGAPQQTVYKALSERETALALLDNASGSESSNEDKVKAFRKPLPPRMDFSGSYQGRNSVFKRLSPFLTSHRAVFSGTRELARPFLYNAKTGFLANSELKRPFIETVIHIRLVSASEGSDKGVKDYVAKLRQRLNDKTKEANEDKKELENMVKLLPENGELLEAFIIDQMLSAVPQLARRWVALLKRVDETLQSIEVSLAPTTAGARHNPLGKQSNAAAFLQARNAKDDAQIKKLEAKVRQTEAIIGLLPIQDSSAKIISGTEQPSARNVMSNALTTPFISVLRQDVDEDRKQLDSLKRRREDMSQKADRLRLELEMMTGEFSGLSVPDIVFTILALFLIEKKDLVSLLDANVLDEMKQDSVLKTVLESVGVSSSSPSAALGAAKKVRQKVKDLYALFDISVQVAKDKSKRTLAPNRGRGGNSAPAKSNKAERTVDMGAGS